MSNDRLASGEESPTTARPIDFDDEPQETGVIQHDSSVPAVSSAPLDTVNLSSNAEAPPAKPPRPLSPFQQAEATLIEAFPSIESRVVKAVLTASGGQVEPAFNALLGMSDPDAVVEATPPPQPPRPSQQVQQDEIYARQLAEHYSIPPRGYGSRARPGPPGPDARPRAADTFDQIPERDRSFIDDDLPVIRENVRQGFLQTQSKVNKWISDFRKKIDGDEDEDGAIGNGVSSGNEYAHGSVPTQQQPGGFDGQRTSRRSTDQERYDSDPRVLSDNFTELEMRDDEEEPPKKPNRPLANPDLFKPTPPPPQSGPVDEVDAVRRQPSPSGGKSKKWQPLTSVAPNPEADDNDPFSLGDSDDEREAKTQDVRSEDTDRLKQAASATVPSGTESGSKLEPQERSGAEGTRNKAADELLKEKS